MAQTDTTGQLSWLLDNLVDQVEHVRQALILSGTAWWWRRRGA